MYVSTGIELTETACAYISSEEEFVREPDSIRVENHQLGSGGIDGQLSLLFDNELLPLGKTYTVHLAEGSIRMMDNPEVTNDEINMTFVVPADLGVARFYYQPGAEISRERFINCYWSYETLPIGEPDWEVYCNGLLVRRYPAHVSYDWDMGSCDLDFGKYIHFERGSYYSVCLSEGSVCGFREDLINKEAGLSFVGRYTGNIERPLVIWSSLDERRPEEIGEVIYGFGMSIQTIEGKTLRIYEQGSEENIGTAIPTITSENGEWLLHADFGRIGLRPDKAYIIEIRKYGGNQIRRYSP